MKSFVLIPGVGIGTIRFGLNPAEVQEAMSEEMVHERWMGGNLNDALFFHGLRFHFDRHNGNGPLEDGSLNEIYVCGRDEASLYEKPLMQWDRHSVVHTFKTMSYRVSTLQNGDVIVEDPYIEISFDDTGHISWFVMVANQTWRRLRDRQRSATASICRPMLNPYSTEDRSAISERVPHKFALRLRSQHLASFTLVGFVAGLLSGYLWYISPNANHYPGPTFGVGLFAATLVCSRFRRFSLASGLLIASVAGFYLAIAAFMETGLSPFWDRLTTVLLGVTPIGFAFSFSIPKERRLSFLGLVGLASVLGGYVFYYITSLRGREDILHQFDLLDPRRLLVFETLRFGVWQGLVAGVLGAYFPRDVPNAP